jgi:UDP-2,3-diacylglucosamine pyrophosphatase LpxH
MDTNRRTDDMAQAEAFVVSDLHLGAGDADPELEDFDQDDKFAEFVAQIAGPGVTLFINGDFIDFAQIPPYEVPTPHHLLWAEAASLVKVQRATDAHALVFSALAGLLAKGGALRLHIGNHDLDLAWPSVQAHLRTLLQPGSPDALQFITTFSRYHGVHIEHGHMFTPENVTNDAEAFIHEWPEGSGDRYLERVWGTDFMLQFYNDLERTYPFADAVKPMVAVLYHGLRNRWVRAREVVRLVLFLKRRGIPLSAITSAVLGPEEPGFTDVLAAFQEDEWQDAVVQRSNQDPDFLAEVDAEVKRLPENERAIVATPRKVEVGAGAGVVEEQGATLGIFREDRELRAARARFAEPGVTHAVYGHTHAVVDGALEGRLFNPGTWLPRLDLSSPVVTAKIKAHGLTLDMLQDPALYIADRRAVHIIPDPPRTAKVRLITAV